MRRREIQGEETVEGSVRGGNEREEKVAESRSKETEQKVT